MAATTLHRVTGKIKGLGDQPSHYDGERSDILAFVPTKNTPPTEPRGIRIPLGPSHWWPDAAMKAAVARAKARGIRAPGIRDLTRILVDQGVDVDENSLGRCLRGEIVTWEVAIPLSKVLGIPPPARLAETQEEGAMLESGDEIKALLDKLRRLG